MSVSLLLVLIADRFRQNIHFPLDKGNAGNLDFMKSYYADHVVYTYRKVNPLQPDMGNFSRSDFSHITPTTRTVNLTSRRKFRATGAYALPGQTFRVTRLDNSNVTVKVFINTLRSRVTHHWDYYGYKRPVFCKALILRLHPMRR